MTVTIVRCSGRIEVHEVSKASAFREIERLINASMLDAVNLRDGRVMLVDDAGYETEPVTKERDGIPFVTLSPTRARKPDNPTATEMYHAVCRPGTTHRIVGDVAIVIDADFE